MLGRVLIGSTQGLRKACKNHFCSSQIINGLSPFNKRSMARYCTFTAMKPDPSQPTSHEEKMARVAAKMAEIPMMGEFIASQQTELNQKDSLNEEELVPTSIPYLKNQNDVGEGRTVFIETYGCQMNVSDTQVAYSIMLASGYNRCESVEEADVVFLNTCAIRDHAEQKVWSRLGQLRHMKGKNDERKVIGVLGCMAERLKEQILEKEKLVDVVAGPDSYRDLPHLVSRASGGEKVINVMLSQDETYAEIAPVRVDDDGISAYVSIGRGCNQHCTYCIVPRTRGVERSRPAKSIEAEIRDLSSKGYKEVTLLGQNVNSYNDKSEIAHPDESAQLPLVVNSKGFKTIYRTPTAGITFAELCDRISKIDPEMRIRFTSPHPKDFPDELLEVIRDRPNICKSIHLPAQSGNSEVLDRMRRGYTREAYLDLVERIRTIVGEDVTLSSDFISGFCGETEAQHQDTVTLMEQVKYDQAFMFAYSLREKTPAHRKYKDDVSPEVKKRRLAEVIDTFHKNLHERNLKQHGKIQLVLVEGNSRRKETDLAGRSDGNRKVIFPQEAVPDLQTYLSRDNSFSQAQDMKPGEYVVVKISGNTGLSLTGKAIARTTLMGFHSARQNGML